MLHKDTHKELALDEIMYKIIVFVMNGLKMLHFIHTV